MSEDEEAETETDADTESGPADYASTASAHGSGGGGRPQSAAAGRTQVHQRPPSAAHDSPHVFVGGCSRERSSSLEGVVATVAKVDFCFP